MQSEPNSPFISPLMQQGLWYGVCEAKRHEIRYARLAPMREAATRCKNFAMRIEAPERNVPTNSHLATIISVWNDSFNRLTTQTGLSAPLKYPKALSPSSRPPFAPQRNREASPLSRLRVDDAVLHRAVRPRPLLSRNTF